MRINLNPSPSLPADASLICHPDLWFNDGSIVLKVQTTLFKVHRSTLASHSTVFADMLGIPQPAQLEMMEGCPVVGLPDDAEDMARLLKAIYDPS